MKTKNTLGARSKPTKRASKTTPAGRGIVRGLEEMVAYKRGEISLRKRVFHIPADFVNAREVRLKTGLSQTQFAKRFGFNPRTLQEWEQGRAFPEGALKAYLKVIERNQRAVETALAS